MEEKKSSISQAVELAKASDLVIVVICLSKEWESEGYDRQAMELPGKQDELVSSLLDSVELRQRFIVVNQSGSLVHMPWQDQASTILQAWYGGQEASSALANVLLGDTSPNGRIPMTWPRSYSDLPFAKDSTSWPGVNDIVKYKEGVKVGYTWFLDAEIEAQWCGMVETIGLLLHSEIELVRTQNKSSLLSNLASYLGCSLRSWVHLDS